MTTVWVGAGRQPATTSIRRDFGESPIDAPCGGFVIDGSGVRLIFKSGPGRTHIHGLSESKFCAGPRILDGLKIVGAHRFGGIAENSLGVLGEGDWRCASRHGRERYDHYGFLEHRYPFRREFPVLVADSRIVRFSCPRHNEFAARASRCQSWTSRVGFAK